MSLSIPDKERDGLRRYGVWAGNRHGHREDVTRCAWTVFAFGWAVGRQCQRRRGYGPDRELCRGHAKKVAARAEEETG